MRLTMERINRRTFRNSLLVMYRDVSTANTTSPREVHPENRRLLPQFTVLTVSYRCHVFVVILPSLKISIESKNEKLNFIYFSIPGM